jgi:hypothetical protein
MLRTLPFRGFVATLFATLVPGCGSGPTDFDADLRRAVTGEVTLDGQPLSHARILFEPRASAGVNTQASADVVDGRFSIPIQRGPAAGEYCVLFDAVILDDVEAVRQAQGGARPKLEHVDIPRRYSAPPGVPVFVSLDGPNSLRLELVSKPR